MTKKSNTNTVITSYQRSYLSSKSRQIICSTLFYRFLLNQVCDKLLSYDHQDFETFFCDDYSYALQEP